MTNTNTDTRNTNGTREQWENMTAHATRYAVRVGIPADMAEDMAQNAALMLVRRNLTPDPENTRSAMRAVLRHFARAAHRQGMAYRPGMRYLVQTPDRPARPAEPARTEYVHGAEPTRPARCTVTLDRIDVSADKGTSVQVWRVDYPARAGREARAGIRRLWNREPNERDIKRGYTLVRKVWRGYVRPTKHAGNSAINELFERLTVRGVKVHPKLSNIVKDMGNGYTRTEAATRAGITPQYAGRLLAELATHYATDPEHVPTRTDTDTEPAPTRPAFPVGCWQTVDGTRVFVPFLTRAELRERLEALPVAEGRNGYPLADLTSNPTRPDRAEAAPVTDYVQAVADEYAKLGLTFPPVRGTV